MTCKDCVHYEVCKIWCGEANIRMSTDCDFVKNKADFVEVKHGKWESYMPKLVYECYVYHKCSVCGAGNPWEHTRNGLPPYCAKCGAKMDGERKTNDE